MSDRIPRRHVVASLTALGFCGLLPHVRALHAASSEQTGRPLAERLATYADRLRYDDLDAATIERVKSHVIDALGCGIAAFDENPVRICRDVALAHVGDTSSVIGTDRRVTPDLATFANGAAIRYALLVIRVIILRHVSRSRRPNGQPPRNSSPRSCSRMKSTAG